MKVPGVGARRNESAGSAITSRHSNRGNDKMCLMLLRATIVCAFAFASTVGCLAAEPVDTQGPLVLQSEGSFFIGGTAHHATGLSGLATGPEVTREGTITTGQMYVQY